MIHHAIHYNVTLEAKYEIHSSELSNLKLHKCPSTNCKEGGTSQSQLGVGAAVSDIFMIF